MKILWIIGLIMFSVCFYSDVSHSSELPKLNKGEAYAKVRAKMLRAGWKPYHASYADNCSQEDVRCKGRPEMVACSIYGDGGCSFLWIKGELGICLETMGAEDDTFYTGKCLWPMTPVENGNQRLDGENGYNHAPQLNGAQKLNEGPDRYWSRDTVAPENLDEIKDPKEVMRQILPYTQPYIGKTPDGARKLTPYEEWKAGIDHNNKSCFQHPVCICML